MILLHHDKALFGSDVAARCIAVEGFVLLLRATSIKPSTAVRCDRLDTDRGSVSPIALEILGLVRRCLMQQVNVRERLYCGLAAAVEACPTLAAPIHDLAAMHLEQYLEIDKHHSPPIFIDKCLRNDDKGCR